MEIPIYQIDAFSRRPFGGNPAAVCPLPGWLPDTLLQQIAAENQLSETAYLVGGQGRYHLRWFTPTLEVELCGHATLASAYVVCRYLEPGQSDVVFDSLSGPLPVARRGEQFELDFPQVKAVPCPAPPALIEGLGAEPVEVFRASDYLAVFDDEAAIRGLTPDFRRLASLDSRGLIVTAPGTDADFVSRFFAPQSGIDEDPVTGSAHTTLAPYWAERLGKPQLFARQVSARGGELWCELMGERVKISGFAAEFLTGKICLPETA